VLDVTLVGSVGNFILVRHIGGEGGSVRNSMLGGYVSYVKLKIRRTANNRDDAELLLSSSRRVYRKANG